MFVAQTEMDTPWTGGFAETVGGVVIHGGEELFPFSDQRWWNRLGADVHEPPLIQFVVRRLHLAALELHEYILSPGHEQPNDGAPFLADCFEGPFW
jgi:hypothetical protein